MVQDINSKEVIQYIETSDYLQYLNLSFDCIYTLRPARILYNKQDLTKRSSIKNQ